MFADHIKFEEGSTYDTYNKLTVNVQACSNTAQAGSLVSNTAFLTSDNPSVWAAKLIHFYGDHPTILRYIDSHDGSCNDWTTTF